MPPKFYPTPAPGVEKLYSTPPPPEGRFIDGQPAPSPEIPTQDQMSRRGNAYGAQLFVNRGFSIVLLGPDGKPLPVKDSFGAPQFSFRTNVELTFAMAPPGCEYAIDVRGLVAAIGPDNDFHSSGRFFNDTMKVVHADGVTSTRFFRCGGDLPRDRVGQFQKWQVTNSVGYTGEGVLWIPERGEPVAQAPQFLVDAIFNGQVAS